MSFVSFLLYTVYISTCQPFGPSGVLG